MDDYLGKLRQKPEHVRKRMAMSATVIAAVALMAFWAVQLQTRLFGGSETNAASVYSPMRSINETIKGSIGEVKLYSQELVNGIKK